jgi:adenylosuccinate lyase
MIERYESPQVREIWSEANKFATWQRVELAAVRAWQELGRVPAEDMQVLEASSRPVDPARVRELDAQVQHDVIAFLTAWSEQPAVSEASRWLHLGLTSSDLLDTALALLLSESCQLLERALVDLLAAVGELASKHKYTPCIGRTHGIIGEPTTFGLKVAGWYDDLLRCRERLASATRMVGVGMFSGPVGMSLPIEDRACEILGLGVASVSSQVVSRDRHTEYVFALATLGTVLERIATEIRHLQRTEVLELEEPFATGQKGSSAMPHKRNPWKSENVCGLARLLRSYLHPALENVVLWHERDISHSSVERIAFPDATHLAHFGMLRMTSIVSGLEVYPDNMRRNLDAGGKLWASHALLLSLIEAGMSRQDAYDLVQGHALAVWNRPGEDFERRIRQDPQIASQVGTERLAKVFEVAPEHGSLERVFSRLGL